MKKFTLLSATAAAAFLLPSTAFAQSTGSITVEEESTEIVVTGARGVDNGIEGIVVPDAARAQAVLTQQNIQRQSAGQSILNTINIIPGVNYTNNDPYGSSGGSIRVRGFDGNRISFTFDGLPLNDTGNYAIFGNQQLDPELIEQVNVNLGQTEVDSPTASAAGGTVNYRTVIPRRELGARVSASIGDFDFHRVFGMIETGELWEGGVRAFVSASRSVNDLFRGPGQIRKQQYNARLYYDLGGRDFISVSGHFNRNRNNQFRNPNINDIRTILGSPSTIPTSGNISFTNPARIGENVSDAQFDSIYAFSNDRTCARATPVTGTRQDENAAPFSTCTNFFGLRINPSDTGNVRLNSRFTLTDNLTLTIDPSYQYTLANGGGTQVLEESAPQVGGNNSPTAALRTGVDINGDGDVLDRVRVFAPNNTNTNRFGLTSSLIWQLSPEHRFRVAYTFDYGRHRQTGDFGRLDLAGRPDSPFGGRNGTAIPVLNGNGATAQLRDRFSIASLHQIAGQYVGRFFEDRLRLEIGLRAPFFHRELNQNCYTNAGGGNPNIGGVGTGGGFVLCAPTYTLAQVQAAANSASAGSGAGFIAPFEQDYDFNEVLPNAGFVYNLTDGLSIFGSYARGFSAPRTDNLYRTFDVDIQPETTDAFDLGVRYNRGPVQAQLTGWMINYQNRIVTSFDADLGISVDRNVGKVESYGFDGSIAFQPIDEVTLYAFASYISAEFQENIRLGNTIAPTGGATLPAGTPIFAPTQGRTVAETPEWQFGGRAQFEFGPVEFGIQGKWVDDRFATDVNDVVVKGYSVFDADARFSLAPWGLERTYLQLNVINIFDERYIGSIGSQINAGQICPAGGTCASNTNNPTFTPGASRTFLATLNVGF
jgi:iron complex outermembrane recepter protein